jgi:hypothetical protein
MRRLCRPPSLAEYWRLDAHSGDPERSFRSIMNTDSGDHEHAPDLHKRVLASVLWS